MSEYGAKKPKRPGCTCSAIGSVEGCCHHDPAAAQKRKRVASRAGKSKPNRELAAIKARLSDLADDVLAGSVDRSDAAVAGQLLNTVIRAVGVELKVREQQELIERLEELESLLESKEEGRGYWRLETVCDGWSGPQTRTSKPSDAPGVELLSKCPPQRG